MRAKKAGGHIVPTRLMKAFNRLFAGVEVFAGRRGRGRRRFGARAMRPAPPPRVTLATRFEGGRRIRDLRLRSGDERRQAVDAGIGDYRLWLRLWLWLILRLLTRFARFTVLARLTMLTWFAVLTRFALLTRFAGRFAYWFAGCSINVRTLPAALLGLFSNGSVGKAILFS